MRGKSLLAALAAALVSCPLPQPLASVKHENGEATTTPPRVDTSTVVPSDTIVKVSTNCSSPRTLTFSASIVDDDTAEIVSARWFLDYAPDALNSRPLYSDEDVTGSDDETQTTRALTPRTLTLDQMGPSFDTAAGATHVLELVISNGFYPPGTEGLALPNRTPQPGFETQVFRWIFQFDSASYNCGS